MSEATVGPTPINHQWRLARKPPGGWPVAEDFSWCETPVDEPGPEQATTRTIYLSLDPYQWGRRRSGTEAPGEVCHGRTVSQVIRSRHPDFPEGAFVFNTAGWQEYGQVGTGVPNFNYMFPRIIDPDLAPISTALGVLGMLGLTAWAGIRLQCAPAKGETVVVSAASGGVGQIAGQIASVMGARVVGIAGIPEKCEFVTGTLGFDACVSHLSPAFDQELKAACPDGIDVYFENVGGKVFETVLPLLNRKSRISQCGMISQYGNATGNAQETWQKTGAPYFERQAVTVHGLFVGNFVADHQARFLAEMGQWVRLGQIRYKEDLWPGLENAPTAFAAMLKGGNFGKTLIGIGDDPTATGAIAAKRSSASII